VKEFLEISFLERLFLTSKSFSTFGNIVFQEYVGLEFLGRYYTVSNRVNLEKGIILIHRFYFFIAQAFLFLMKNIVFTRFYLRKFHKCSHHRFSQESKV